MTLNIHFRAEWLEKPVCQLSQDTWTVKSLFNCCGRMTSPTTPNLNITLYAPSYFLYGGTGYKSFYDVDNWRMVPGRQFFCVRNEQDRGGRRVGRLRGSAKRSLPGRMVQFIYLQAVNLLLRPLSRGFDSTWTD